MKNLLILALAAGLVAALFFTRPTIADFQAYVKAHPEIVQGQAPKGESIIDAVTQKIRTYTDTGQVSIDPVQDYLSQCKFENRFYMWINVIKDGQIIYTGMASHWIKRNVPVAAPNGSASPA